MNIWAVEGEDFLESVEGPQYMDLQSEALTPQEDSRGKVGPLSGIRVVSFTTGIAGPLVGRFLAQLGADVIKIESRSGGVDSFRYFEGSPTEEQRAEFPDMSDQDVGLNSSSRFAEVNLNVRSLSVNLKSSKGLDIARRLVERADVLVENFRPGVMTKLGIGYDDVAPTNERLIYLAMPGMGETGPKRRYGTWGPMLASYSGLTHLWNHPGSERPVGSQAVFPDYLAGVMGPLIVIAELLQRAQSGRGCFVDFAQAEGAVYMLGPSYLYAALTGTNPAPRGNQEPGCAPSGVFPCAGEREWCAVSVASDQQWEALRCILEDDGLECPQDIGGRRERLERLPELNELLAAWVQQRDGHDAMRTLQRSGIPAGVVVDAISLAQDPQLLERGFIQQVSQPLVGDVTVPRIPVRFDRSALPETRPAPLIGQHSEEIIIEELGYSSGEYARLVEENVVW